MSVSHVVYGRLFVFCIQQDPKDKLTKTIINDKNLSLNFILILTFTLDVNESESHILQ